MSEQISKELIIIGSGPAGLKCAEEAQKTGLDYLVIERGEVGQAWKEIRPDMPMLSPCHPQRDWTSISSDFPIWKLNVKRPYCTAHEFCNYMDEFNSHFNLNIRTRTEIKEVSNNGDDFILLDQNNNQYQAPILLVALGVFGNPYTPQIKGIKNNPDILHSHLYKSAKEFTGQSVLVVGAGNSAAEIAIDLTSTAMVFLVSRKDLKYFADTQKLYHIRGISESYLKELIKMELIRYRAYQEIQKIDGNTIYFKDWKLDVHKIIFATGYHGNIGILKNFKLSVNKSNYPEVNMSGESIQYPNLFFAGPLSYQNTSSIVLHGFMKSVLGTINRITEKLKSECKNYLKS
jgi:putative flavoprotein involved in K+ transport